MNLLVTYPKTNKFLFYESPLPNDKGLTLATHPGEIEYLQNPLRESDILQWFICTVVLCHGQILLATSIQQSKNVKCNAFDHEVGHFAFHVYHSDLEIRQGIQIQDLLFCSMCYFLSAVIACVGQTDSNNIVENKDNRLMSGSNRSRRSYADVVISQNVDVANPQKLEHVLRKKSERAED